MLNLEALLQCNGCTICNYASRVDESVRLWLLQKGFPLGSVGMLGYRAKQKGFAGPWGMFLALMLIFSCMAGARGCAFFSLSPHY
jgi:hypothetical protein